jgi:hypothetical protein
MGWCSTRFAWPISPHSWDGGHVSGRGGRERAILQQGAPPGTKQASARSLLPHNCPGSLHLQQCWWPPQSSAGHDHIQIFPVTQPHCWAPSSRLPARWPRGRELKRATGLVRRMRCCMPPLMPLTKGPLASGALPSAPECPGSTADEADQCREGRGAARGGCTCFRARVRAAAPLPSPARRPGDSVSCPSI